MSKKYDRIVEAVKSSSDIWELERKLWNEGQRFLSPAHFRTQVYRAWHEFHQPAIKQIRQRPVEELGELPYSQVERNGITYKIHGLAHGQPPLLPLSSLMLDYIRSSVTDYQQQSEEYCLEPKFNFVFGLDEQKELKILPRAFRRLGMQESVELQMALLSSIPFIPLSPLMMNLFPHNGMKELFTSMKDPRYLSRGREIFNLSYGIPEPLNMQFQKESKKTFFVYMSQEMAKEMVARAEHSNVKVMHALVGFAHESHLCYLLKNGLEKI